MDNSNYSVQQGFFGAYRHNTNCQTRNEKEYNIVFPNISIQAVICTCKLNKAFDHIPSANKK